MSRRTTPRRKSSCIRFATTAVVEVDGEHEGVWSLLKRSIANFAAAELSGLVRIIKRKLKKIQYRPHLINGCPAATGLTIEPW